jgi:hypothetical protein
MTADEIRAELATIPQETRIPAIKVQYEIAAQLAELKDVLVQYIQELKAGVKSKEDKPTGRN